MCCAVAAVSVSNTMQYTHTHTHLSVNISNIFMPVKIKNVVFISSTVGLMSQVHRNIVPLLVLVTVSCEQRESGWVR